MKNVKSGTVANTWIKTGFFFLGFSLMSNVIILVIRHLIVPHYIDPVVNWDDPRGVDGIFALVLIPFWFLLSLLSGMLNVNLSLRLSQSERRTLLPYLAIVGYLLFTYGASAFIYNLLHSG